MRKYSQLHTSSKGLVSKICSFSKINEKENSIFLNKQDFHRHFTKDRMAKNKHVKSGSTSLATKGMQIKP